MKFRDLPGKQIPLPRIWVMQGSLVLSCGNCHLWKSFFITQYGKIQMSPIQNRVMEFAMLAPGRHRQRMIEYVYPDAETSPTLEAETLSVHINLIRQKTETVGYSLTRMYGRGMAIFGVWIEEIDNFEFSKAWQRTYQERMHDEGNGRFIRGRGK